MSSSEKIVDSITWFRKKKKIQKEINGFFLAMKRATTIVARIMRIEIIVDRGSNKDLEISMPWAMLSLVGTG